MSGVRNMSISEYTRLLGSNSRVPSKGKNFFLKISLFLPKEAKCDRRGPSICCRRTEPLPVNVTDAVDCESSGPGYECADFDTCNPKTFLAKKVTSTADLLFEEMNLIEANPSGGLTINTAKSPCKSPTKVCCQPMVASDPANRGTTSSPKPVVPR